MKPNATAAAFDPSGFSKVNASEAISASWEDQARKGWEYYLEEPLVICGGELGAKAAAEPRPAAQAIARRRRVGPLKNKQQLVKAIEKAAREEAAEDVKREAVETAKKERAKDR